jgi:hypothetical protein
VRRLFVLAVAVAGAAGGACDAALGVLDVAYARDDGGDGAADAGDEPGPIDATAPCGTATDPKNCGACGLACRTGFGCYGGICGDRVVSVAAGGTIGCALLAEGTVYCWGGDSAGETGGPPSGTCVTGACSPTATRVAGVAGAVEIALGYQHGCARDAAGNVFCWGRNDDGQLGQPTQVEIDEGQPRR